MTERALRRIEERPGLCRPIAGDSVSSQQRVRVYCSQIQARIFTWRSRQLVRIGVGVGNCW